MGRLAREYGSQLDTSPVEFYVLFAMYTAAFDISHRYAKEVSL